MCEMEGDMATYGYARVSTGGRRCSRSPAETNTPTPRLPLLCSAHHFMQLFSALTPQKQVIGFALLRELMARSIPNG